jgi:phosphate transport system permease protein
MATEQATAESSAFGTVSRTVGVVFRYVLLVATLAGIVALGILLAFVANDAIRPFTAEPTWLAITALTLFGLPVGVGGWLYRSRPAEFRTGLGALGLFFVGVLYGGGAVILFIDVIPSIVWLAFLVALAVPAIVSVALERIDRRISFLARVLVVTVVGALSLWQVPGLVQSVPVLPADWVILLLTVGGPAAGLAAWYVDGRLDGRRPTTVAGLGSLALVGVAGYAGLATGIGASALTVLMSAGLLPFVVYVAIGVYERGREAVGFLLPATGIGGVAAWLMLERVLGLAGPNAWLTWEFVTSTQASPPAETAGIYPGIVGTILLMINVALLAFPIGVGAAVYLEEYAPDSRFTRIIDVNISNLAGVPSVVYGLLGLGALIRFGGLAPGTVVVGGMTLALLILPIVIISAREAIRSVPDTQRKASYGMGATRWQTIRNVVLPEAFPGILTGTILALGRAVGETAPLIVIGAPAIFGVPDALGDRVGAIPVQIYAWASTFGSEAFYTTVLAAGVLTIVVILLTMNSIAIVLRNKYQRET